MEVRGNGKLLFNGHSNSVSNEKVVLMDNEDGYTTT